MAFGLTWGRAIAGLWGAIVLGFIAPLGGTPPRSQAPPAL